MQRDVERPLVAHLALLLGEVATDPEDPVTTGVAGIEKCRTEPAGDSSDHDRAHAVTLFGWGSCETRPFCQSCVRYGAEGVGQVLRLLGGEIVEEQSAHVTQVHGRN